VERFLDTPVKRYSSGMYVRLAFSVAAHLEPEILIVDEVLAVGDADFQKRCLGKMDEVSKGGRTILFVSHNMAAVQSLTTRALLLEDGKVDACSTSDEVIKSYLRRISTPSRMGGGQTWGEGKHTAILEAHLLDENGFPTTRYNPGEPLRLKVVLKTDGTRGTSLELFLTDATRSRLGLFSSYQFHGQAIPERKGRYCVTLSLGPYWLASGKYGFDIATSIINTDWDHKVDAAIEFDVAFSNALGRGWDFKQSYGYGSLTLLSTPSVEFVPQ
jgi:lipopolysaccharide transport system ATP-binding protein